MKKGCWGGGPDASPGRRVGLALGLVSILLVTGCASTAIRAPGGPGQIAGDCAALEVRPDPGKIYAIPKLADENAAGRCNVADRTVAVHVLGRFRQIYGPEPTGPGGAIPERAEAAIGPVIKKLTDRAALLDSNQPLRLLIFVHGGLVEHKAAVLGSESLAPGMLADNYEPIFLIWNSDIVTSYGDRLCCVRGGEEWFGQRDFFIPVRLVGDLSASGARAFENFGQQWIRFRDSITRTSGTAYYLRPGDGAKLCSELGESCPRFIYPFDPGGAGGDLNGAGEPLRQKQFEYAALWPVRVVTTATLPEVGTQAWGNMIRRTRLALEFATETSRPMGSGPSCADQTLAAEGGTSPPANGPTKTQGEQIDDDTGFQKLGGGGFTIFFQRLACEIKAGSFKDSHGQPVKVEIYFFGHSMGAIVGNEAIWRYPDLPWKRIVYMAAANSIRDFRTSVIPVLSCDDPDLAPTRTCQVQSRQGLQVAFYNLMLHPLADARELNFGGAPPQGSLLEWIDEMFGGARSFDDRTLGKWTNVEETLPLFPPAARARMTFRVFPMQESLLGGDLVKHDAFLAQCTPGPGMTFDKSAASPKRPFDDSQRCHPTKHGDFTNYSFWRPMYLTGRPDDPPY